MRLVVLLAALAITTQPAPPVAGLIAAVRPALPFPEANADGDLPADENVAAKWFVVWPAAADARIIVRANPLHPEVQQASAAAMAEINAVVAAAERRAQASYEQALERLRKTGKAGELESVSLDDEGVAGDRIDAELEVTIALVPAASVELTTARTPVVRPGAHGAWVVTIPAHTYREMAGNESHERFRRAETRIYLDLTAPPALVPQADRPAVRLTVAPSATSVAVAMTGNAELIAAIAGTADWTELRRP